MILTAQQLHGESSTTAELMGKPHIGAFYANPENYKTQTLEKGARCVVCGRPAVDAHHVVPRGHAAGFTVNSPLGRFVVYSPLFALCRTCHDQFPSGYKLIPARYRVAWEWKDEQYQKDWWSGHTLAHLCTANSDFLFEQGHYIMTDTTTGRKWQL